MLMCLEVNMLPTYNLLASIYSTYKLTLRLTRATYSRLMVFFSRRWNKEQKIGSPIFGYMPSGASTVKTPVMGAPPYQVSLEDRLRWAQIADAMAHANHYGVSWHTQSVSKSLGSKLRLICFTCFSLNQSTVLPDHPPPYLGTRCLIRPVRSSCPDLDLPVFTRYVPPNLVPVKKKIVLIYWEEIFKFLDLKAGHQSP